MTGRSIACPTCGLVSFNEYDIDHRYCGACHTFHSDMKRKITDEEQEAATRVLWDALEAAANTPQLKKDLADMKALVYKIKSLRAKKIVH